MDPDPEPSREPEEPGAGDGGPGGGGSGGAGGGLLASVHLVHVQLCGGAPWGFTLKGGLEHGGPLIVSKVEDGGKAALSQKMRSGDELVNINGTPLYGSRQEALILIKGSYRTLKMIIRRRNIPVIRPHSWHLAKLSEGRTEAATMPCPPDAFSLSWHSGCDTSDLPLSWTPLSRHCSTDKSSSLGSMESLGPPSQSYCEGSLSPIDQAMYQNKRDSAYSSFSASSNASDSALRPEEGSSAECVQQPDPRYLQTGGEGGDPAVVSRAGSHPPGHQPVSYARAGPFLASAKAAPSPPQPPVRQDSLRACNPEGPKGPLNPKGRWTSDTSLSVCGREPQGSTGQDKDSLATEQYYLLSSHSDQSPAMEMGVPNAESLLNEEAEGDHPLEDPGQHLERKSNETDLDSRHITCPSPWKKGWSRPLGHHRHSAPEHLLAAQLQALNVAHIQEGPQWTVSPLHVDQKGPRGPKLWMNQDRKGQGSPYQAGELDPCPGTEEGPQHHPHGLERPRSASVDLPPALSPKHQHQPPLSGSRDSQVASSGASALKEGVRDPGGSHPAPRKGVLAQHRSAQMRRQSDRFATNLRNEIQWRKAQLQKAKGTAAILCGEEAVQETEEPPSSPSSVDPPSWSPPPSALDPSPSPPPPPIAESMPHGSGPSIRRWGSELSVFGKEATSHSPGRGSLPAPESRWKAQGPERPPKSPVPPMSGRGRRWHWSPEYKLQPHDGNPQPAEPESPSRLSEESSGLLPFADRRRFFEESSKPLSPVHLSPRRGKFGGVPPHRREEEQNTFQLVSSEHREQQQQRRHSMDQAFGPSPSPPTYQDFRPEVPTFYKPLARHRPDWECWQPLPCSCAPREACLFCYGERCPSLHQRNLSVPPGHCAHRCHPHSWTHCPDCCCPAQHQRLEERGAPWHGRKAFQMEFPVDDWEPPAINRKTSQSMSELPQHKMGFARASPFWTCFKEAEPEWPPAFCRAISARNLSWDGERPGRVAAVPETPDYEEPRKPPLRGRAYSESHLCAELASGATERERREAPLAKVEETLLEPPCVGKKKGPPPPRPPPPNWEKYRRASHNQLLSTKAGPAPLPEDPRGSGQEAARQRSQSLPLEQLWSEAAHLQPLPCASPPREGTASSPGAPAEQSSLRYYCHSSPCQTPEWSTPDASERSGSSRPSSSLDEDAMPESVWEKGQSGPSTCKTTEPSSPVSLPSSPSPKGHDPPQAGAARESRSPNARGPMPPFCLNSEELMRDVAGRDRSLARVLGPALGQKTVAEVMEDLFSAGDSSVWKERACAPQAGDEELPERQPTQPLPPSCGGALGALPGSAYYNMSVGKAKLPGKVKDPPAVNSEEEEEEMDRDLAQKKVQLIESISRKLVVLQEAQRGLEDDLNANVALGKEVESHVKRVCKAHEFEKFRLFIGDLDKVVNLLLSLSGRLARVENALGSLAPDAPEEEKLALLEKKRQLTAQLEDARELQEHVARRERAVFASVSRCLPSEQLQDYQHFVRMKSALAIQQRQLDDKIKLGEEQLRSLRESLRRTGAREY